MDAIKVEVIDLQTELQVFDPIHAQIEEMKQKNASIVFDYEDKQGNKDARSHIATLRKLKKPVNDIHKMAKAEALKFTRALDGKKKQLIGAVDEMIQIHHEPIWEIEQRELAIQVEKQLEAKRIEEEAEAARVAEIEKRERELAEAEAKVQAEQEKLEREARERQISEDAKKQVAEDAKRAVIDADKHAEAFLAAAAKQREEAEDKAKQDAINAENARKQAAIDAENAKAVAVQKAKDEAVAREAEREAHLLQERRAEESRIQEEQAAEQLRIADTAHRSKIHRAIYSCYTDNLNIDKIVAKYLTQALIDHKIPRVEIKY